MSELVNIRNTDIFVSKLCFGSLTMSPLQRNFSATKAKEIYSYAIKKGINFIDTAELYNNYNQIRAGIEDFNRLDLVIATKSYAYSKETLDYSVNKALNELNTKYLDIFLLHEQESIYTIKGHFEALQRLKYYKKKGIIRAIGLSTHFVSGVEAAIQTDGIDIIHPIINYKGLGIVDGSREQMENKIFEFSKKGFVYAMKALGGGNLLNDIRNSFEYILSLDYLDSIAIGMQDENEIDINYEIIVNKNLEYIEKINKDKLKEKKLHIAYWCKNCNKCIKICHQDALIKGENKPKIVHDKCLKCGYCASACEDFCIKVI